MICPDVVLRRTKSVMWALAIAGAVVGIARFVFGLGASTNMLDSLPWGWWKIFNMVAGAALATSGFVVAAIIYILRLKKYYPVARLSVLVGFLGYGSSLTALIFDIGLPHRGWHPFFMWNPHSFLFEVFWCVSIYWGVTALELLPILSERFPFPKVTHFLHEVMLPFVVLGVTLSTMHHSSLGSLFLASPTRLHPLWHSMWIPPEFFISAMGAGVAVLVLLLGVVNYLYKAAFPDKLVSRLAVISAVLLGIYLGVKVVDFSVHGKWALVFGPELTWESRVFWVEIVLQAIVPIVIFSLPVLRRSKLMLFCGSSAALIGLVMHRIDTGIVGYFRTSEAIYIPNLAEFILSFGVLSAAGLMFFFLIERFPVLRGAGYCAEDGAPVDPEGHQPVPPWTWAEAKELFLGQGARRVGWTAVVVVPLTWFGLQGQGTSGFEAIAAPVRPAIQSGDALRTVLRLDANGNGDYVMFPHEQHKTAFVEKYGLELESTCVKCHHLNLPNDNQTLCRACHTDMELPRSLFDPERHAERFEDEAQRLAFEALDLSDRRDNYQACLTCHEESMAGLTTYARTGFNHHAPGFVAAMHGKCMTCHRLEERDPADPFSLGNCIGCHRWTPREEGEALNMLEAGEEPLPSRIIERPVIIPAR